MEEEDALVLAWIEAGAPSPLQLYLAREGLPSPADRAPLTVAQAATREGVSTKTIRRRLPKLTAMEPAGAWLNGGTWRIDPAGLDALREVPGDVPAPPKAKPGRKSAPRRVKPTNLHW